MTPKEFIRKVDHGDKVEVVLQEPSYYRDPKKVKEVLFFRGFRILCGASLTNEYDDIAPVFVRPTKRDGTMGRKHYGNEENEVIPWWSNIKSVKVLEKAAWRK